MKEARGDAASSATMDSSSASEAPPEDGPPRAAADDGERGRRRPLRSRGDGAARQEEGGDAGAAASSASAASSNAGVRGGDAPLTGEKGLLSGEVVGEEAADSAAAPPAIAAPRGLACLPPAQRPRRSGGERVRFGGALERVQRDVEERTAAALERGVLEAEEADVDVVLRQGEQGAVQRR